jgi:hypothetical protein
MFNMECDAYTSNMLLFLFLLQLLLLLLLGPFVAVVASVSTEAVAAAAAGGGIHVKTLRFEAAAAPWCQRRHVTASVVVSTVVVMVKHCVV